MTSLSIWHWLIVFGVVILIFSTHKLGSVGGNIEVAIRNFKKVMTDGDWSKIAVALLIVLLLLITAQMLTAR